MTTGVVVERMTECPICKGQGSLWGASGCPVCTNGMVKQRNLDRASEPLPGSGWPVDALDRLWYMVTTRAQRRRIRNKAMRAYLEANDTPSNLDRLDRKPKHRRTEG